MTAGMYLFKDNNINYFRFSVLDLFPEISHGIFTRHGGFSKNQFSSLNAGFNSGDEEKAVKKNRALILETIGGDHLVSSKQVHGKDVLILDKKTCEIIPHEPKEADAIITNITGLTLLIQVADCQPVLLYDSSEKVIANIHSGWRGSINNIIGQTIEIMENHFGCSPENMVAGVGPSLGPCCAEFIHYKEEIPEKYWKYKNDANHFDFWEISKDQMISKGVRDENIAIGSMCTKCHTDQFYSYRGEKKTGRLACTIGLV